jgi:hypothetical protein
MSEAAESGSGFLSRWWRVIAMLGGVAIAFFAGFVPQYLHASHLESELSTVRQERQHMLEKEQLLQLRGAVNQVFVQVTRNNYGVASQGASEFFSSARNLMDRTPDSNLKGTLQRIMDRRDAVISGLSKADPAVRTPIGSMVDELSQRIPVELRL